MSARVRFTGVKSLVSKLGRRQREAARLSGKQLRVGYSAPYALRVHEDLEMFHSNGQAKFLSQPAREYRHVMASIVRRSVAGRLGKDDLVPAILRGFLAAGMFLRDESQALVPVDTGFLRDSAFVWIEDR